MNKAWAVARFTVFGDLEPAEMLILSALNGPTWTLGRGAVLRHEGEPSPKMYLLHSGWTASGIEVAGGARQIIKVHLPGDLVGLPSLALTHAGDTLYALCPVEVSAVPPDALRRLFTESPRLAALLFLISQEERIRLMDRLASVGRTDAVSRIAALTLQLHARVQCHDPDVGDTFHVPLKQSEIADLTGLSKIHVNRTLQQLRGEKVIRWANRSATILDHARLQELAQLQPRELNRKADWLPTAIISGKASNS